ncbi:MAG: hypothetical protein ABSG70_17520 [Terriglobales bacterium]|jgi:hypothetical protein
MKNIKGLFAVVLLTLSAAGTAWASPKVPAIPRTLSNARFVYVAAYDGDQFDPRLLPDDREAISRVQDTIQKWGKLIVVYRPEDADVILMVQSRPSEDVLALYDAHGSRSVFLWRVMGRGGLQQGEAPLVSQFEKAWNKIQN